MRLHPAPKPKVLGSERVAVAGTTMVATMGPAIGERWWDGSRLVSKAGVSGILSF